MNHAITIGGLLLTVGILAGAIAVTIGAFMFFAGSMSDALEEGDAAGKQGCIVFAVGAALFIGCIMLAVL